jgi:glucosylceramidase
MRLARVSLLSLAVLAASCGRSVTHQTAEPLSSASAASAGAELTITSPASPFAGSRLSGAPVEAAGAGDIVVDESRRHQAILAFGGAFNERGWDALRAVAEREREAALRALFARDTGLGFDWCRLPIGASDYAMNRYSLDESPGDYQMQHFSIDRDREQLIPYVKAALRVRPDLKFWASAWSPPTWMKTNGAYDSGAMKDDPEIYAAYALYLAKFVESYAKEGIPVTMVVPQNEPGQLTHYPSCDWTPAQYVRFIRDYAGPTFKRRGLTTQLFVGTINRADWDVVSVLRDESVAPFISGVTLQWLGLAQAAAVRAARPDLPLLQSETECGNNHWLPTFNPEKPPNDFAYAAYTWRKLQAFFAAGASSYMLWNMVLDEEGKNIDSAKPWPQNSAVVVDRASHSVRYTPMFWATKHFSKLLARGAVLVDTSGAYPDRIAFVNPDGSVVLELLNEAAAPVTLNVVAKRTRYAVGLPAQSFATLLVR